MSDIFGTQARLPYSTGLIWSYCLENKEIRENYSLSNWFWYKDSSNSVENILNKLDEPAVLGLATFIWNWKFNSTLCKKVKEKWPNCLIVIGGWQPPMADRSQGFFEKFPFFDIIVHGEGEEAFKDILLENLKTQKSWENVKGCSIPFRLVLDKTNCETAKIKDGLKLEKTEKIKNPKDLTTYVTEPRKRIDDLQPMPSPYLNGLFDELIKDCKYDIEGTIETTRGCPFGCTFCEIGTKYYQKIKTHGEAKIFKEIDWLSKNKAAFIYNADSNFGMLPEHVAIAEYLVKKKKETGYPQKHRCDWAKVHGDKVIQIAKILYKSGLESGITIALQSLNPKTLEAVKRKNMDDGKLAEFLNKYNDDELASFTEIILGLPEETLETFSKGICKVIELGQHDYVGINELIALPNTPFGDPEYRKKYGLNLVETWPSFVHVDNSNQRDEVEQMVIGSNTMSVNDYKEAMMFKWLVLFGHYLGTMQYIARFLRNHKKIDYYEFYNDLYNYIKSKKDGFLFNEYKETYGDTDKAINKSGPWGRVLENIRPNFAWKFEEGTSIRIAENRNVFYKEIKSFLTKYDLDSTLLDELIDFQISGVLWPDKQYDIEKEYSYNFLDLITKNEKLIKNKIKYCFKGKNFNNDIFNWAKEILWWGRKTAECKTKIITVDKKINIKNTIEKKEIFENPNNSWL